MNYESMSTVELRTLVRQQGLAKGAAVAVARKPDLIALLNGTGTLSAPALPVIPAATGIPVAPQAIPSAAAAAPLPRDITEIKLTAGTPTEQRILAYLRENASAILAEKINTGTKTLAGAVDYATKEAKKLASGGDGCVCVDDATVFGWIIHFFEEDHITEKAKRPAVVVPAGVAIKKPVKPPKAPKVKKPEPVPVVAPTVPPAAIPEPAKPAAESQATMFEDLLA